MRNSLILQTAARLLVPLILLFSVFLMLRGHNESGGGFIGGLVAGTSFALYAMAYGTVASRRALRVTPQALMTAGLATALLSGVIPLFQGGSMLQGLWAEPFGIKIGTPILFDIGVYLLVIGIALIIVYELDESGVHLFPKEERPSSADMQVEGAP